jgi:ribosomal protein S18 acetylase RimI-like enzyme
VQIRKPTPNDVKELARLIKGLEQSDTYLPEKKKRMRAFSDLDKAAEEAAQRYISRPRHISFVADGRDHLKGFIAGEIHERKYRIYNKEGYVTLWYVQPDSQGNKIGKELFNTLVDEFKKVGCTHVGLDTLIENTKAIEIYEHMGFTKRLIVFFKPLERI